MSGLSFRGKDYEIDVADLDLNELIDFEEASGVGFAQLMSDESLLKSPRVIRACAWIVIRRDHPELTLQEAGEVKMTGGGDPAPKARKATAPRT